MGGDHGPTTVSAATGLRARLRSEIGALWADGRGQILLAVSLGQLLSLGVRLAFPALLPEIKADFALTNTVAGILLSVLWISYATAQLPGGFMSDRLGERATLVASALVGGLGIGVLVSTPFFGLFVAGLLLFGFGTGLYGTPRITVLSDIYPERDATAISVSSAIGNVGNAGLPVVATVVAGWFAWRTGIGIALPAFALLAVGLWVTVPARTAPRVDTGASSREAAAGVATAVTRRPVLLATGAMICLAFVWQGFTAFLPTYLIEVKGLEASTAATTLGAFFVGGAIIQPIAGGVADRYAERRFLPVLAGGTIVALAAFPFASAAPAFAALAVLASLQLAFWPIIFAYIPRALPDAGRGSGFGLLRTAFIYVGATGSIVVGALADAGWFDESFALLAGVAGLALLLSSRLPSVE